MQEGLFIVLEGGEGSGKSTLANHLELKLRELDLDVIMTREPGGVKVAEDIRRIIMDYEISPKTESLLFAAARVEHLNLKVLPNLKKGTHVISDRYIDSSIVYQGYARNLGIDVVKDLNSWATDYKEPDLVFYLKLDPLIGLRRIVDNNRATNRFDHDGIEFHQSLAKGYDEVLGNRKNVVVLDASLSPSELCNIAIKNILERING